MIAAPAAAGAARVSLADVPLFAGIAHRDLERVEHFMARFEAGPDEVLFRQGDTSDRLYVIESGHVEVHVELTGGQTRPLAIHGPAELLGETSLLSNGRRTATAVVREPTAGWMLYRSGMGMLALDASSGAVELMARVTELALARLRARYETIAAELHEGAAEDAAVVPHGEALPADPALVGAHYLAGLLCFRDFHGRAQIEDALGGATPLELVPGAVLLAPGVSVDELLLVLRGALDVSVRCGRVAQRVRLAGPGRFVGHVGALDGGANPIVAHARDRVVLVKLPERVRRMLRDPSVVARRFAAALAEDIARALRKAERPVARTAGEAV